MVVHAATGVTYLHQAGGVECQQRKVEGYLVPVGDEQDATPFRDLFAVKFRGNPPPLAHNAWADDAISELASLVARVPFWLSQPDGTSERTTLEIDRNHLDDLTEAWVPVITAQGRGVLLFKNSD